MTTDNGTITNQHDTTWNPTQSLGQMNPYELLNRAIEAQLALTDHPRIIEMKKLGFPRPQTVADKVHHFREFRTVTVSGVRQTGKSQWILDHCDSKSLVVVSTLTHRTLFIERHLQSGASRPAETPIVLKASDLPKLFRTGLNPERENGQAWEVWMSSITQVFVDDASYVFKEFSCDRFYKHLAQFVGDDTRFFLFG